MTTATQSLIAEWSTSDYARSMSVLNTSNFSAAEDAISNATLSALNNLSDDHPNPLAWLTLTLKRACWSQNRKESTEVTYRQYERGELRHAYYSYVEDDLNEKVQTKEALSRLNRNQRLAISMRAWGYSYKEIASIMDWTYTKVNRCITEGREKMKGVAV